MTLQTVWHDNGTVKCVDSADSPAVVHGAEKATADTDVVGEITLDHVVTVVDGEVTDAVYDPPPVTDAMWLQRIHARARTEIDAGITVTVNDVDYLVATNADARTLIAGAKIRAEEAIAAGQSITRKIPTDKGVKAANEQQLIALFDLVESRHQAVMDRVEELEAMVADGTITEDDLDSGWPA